MLEFLGENPFLLCGLCGITYVVPIVFAFYLGRRGLPVKWVGWRNAEGNRETEV